MKKLLVLLFSVISMASLGQSNFEKQMNKAFVYWENGESVEAIALLDSVSGLNQENWIPVYYKILIEITQGFVNPHADGIELSIAENRMLIEYWKAKQPDEWLVLRGMNETLDLLTDPMIKGKVQSAVVNLAYQEALNYNPSNPRALYGLASFHLHSAAYVNVDKSLYCAMLEQAIVLFDSQPSNELFYPSWGKDWAVKTLELCNSY